MGCVQYQSELFTLLFFILKVIFILLSGFAGRDIKYLCIWSRHRKYLLPFFCYIGPAYIIQVFFSYILISLKKVFTRNAMEYLE